ncbi:MAG: hypothetical protein GIKADHBN_03237 [Phycisphaerales bacterium]|nr:hypothetical protein [Phycisphaerales bacterium]
MVVRTALASGPAPWKFPPTRIWPPPAGPDASIVPETPTYSPSTEALPPLAPATVVETSILPSTATTPLAASSLASFALTVPALRMASEYMSPTA